MSLAVRDILTRGPVIPVVTIEDASTGPDLARALMDGGITVIEVTMRTPAALDAVRAIRAEVPGMIAGVGTLLDPDRIPDVLAAGAQFAVSPGLDLALVDACRTAGLPLLPGIQTVSEAMAARRAGLDTLKFFPAKTSGGPAALQQIQPVLPDLRFCPTGGIGQADAKGYLALPNVLCVGGSFPASSDAIRRRDWTAVRASAAAAAELNG
ncbi:bifunctional 4-hydroxy-2-oxoglutarate aldolase/2-dehydro-3-deoxy-phosphogluconate aldolase [Thalassobaculum sp. OXR-137]|uniref:bifunctional 4-hydroxy-2-oxoglutarate aldolase/2-dehydro-3-deoxy-phosphogluconate aldolase n=1 Tax=Thalassobaculum sp. OXR-137 TaxID=3100173 RepID=UPI002AC98B28|nr:bifunctional 4-hydroxy-2-oxoglutarate aldolase/2-dehydro-3-deoxy-phosphogluconate aldolase [Thalassobaculum sp. OXR-137]WPZ35278.1 bifunctional 4-hydroxy-2-oxoglutarate aldolase/2-dehydro-3-deoxy-phosphogluconate aldolase [Thalassobaculum sp. OXR-137]